MKKNTISNYVKGVVLSVGLIVASSCSLEDNLVNPSALSPDQAGSEFIFNGLQLNFSGFFLTTTQIGMDNTRMLAMFGATYENAYTANNFNGVWTSAYSDVMVNANLLLVKSTDDPATTASEYNAFYQGVAKTMKAYVLLTLVDFFGDVPYSQAFNTADFKPTVDTGVTLYAEALTLLNDAVVDYDAVDASTVKPAQDMFYAADHTKWRRLAKTIKMKLFLNRRLVDVAGSTAGIAALLTEGDLINSTATEFSFKAPANSVSNPNTYHPWFFNNYQTSAGQYMSNSYMKEMFDGKGTARDPRMRFYFYRQVTSPTTDVNDLTCSSATSPPAHYPPGTAYCQLPAGYWGRDHLNNEGTPPDGLKRTTYGLYPAGGKFDASNNQPVDVAGALAAGAAGKGILPIMMSFFTQFMKAEYELTLNANPVQARVDLEAATRASITRVITFNPAQTPTTGAVANTFNATAVQNYVNVVLANYDLVTPIAPNATQAENRMDVIAKEYWVAMWGNGVEAYNMVRRTGKPANLQPALAPNPGEFYRSFTYPGIYVFRNSNAVQKPNNTVKVFWDTNPDGFVK